MSRPRAYTIKCDTSAISNSAGHPRLLLSKALTSSYKVRFLPVRFITLTLRQHVRIFATSHLGKLIREASGSFDWLIRLLLTQLYDASVDVCHLAVQLLEEACEIPEHLEIVVAMRPSIDHLGEIGEPLLVK